MKNKFIIAIILIVSFGACSSSIHTNKNSKANIQEKTRKKFIIEDLADKNYRFCSESNSDYNLPSGNHSDLYKWCFDFRKTGNHIEGVYGYQAPKDSARICISGTVQSNQVNGIGYEYIDAGTELIKSKNVFLHPKKIIWNDGSDKSSYLMVGSSHVHSRGKYLIRDTGQYKEYRTYLWRRYDITELNLSNFYQSKLTRFISPEKCTDMINKFEANN